MAGNTSSQSAAVTATTTSGTLVSQGHNAGAAHRGRLLRRLQRRGRQHVHPLEQLLL
ncbi:hypothetical protein ABT288_08695 [Streptomyces sp. NPDC001093]|uniref:hypothetical protein n=1 Tax=Streptomyces sp. NPDC001093 TaxID=3154376 RepID=UPI00331FF445